MTSMPIEVGTLIVVILKAKNLPNKRHIGKQDPYCSVKLNNETRRTKAIKRGGQHPEWDEEVRFTILEDLEDELARTAGGHGADASPPPLPPKKDKKKIKSGKKMQLTCYADDPREPDLIGETMVDLTEVLTKGETDEWFTLSNKEKYCGEVYLELTFWSNEKPPEKRTTPPASTFHPQYGGPGSFTPSSELPTSLKHGGSNQNTPSPSRISSSGPDVSLPPALRPSGSLAQINLYTPPYEQHNRHSDIDQLSNGVAELTVDNSSRRRESFPPVQAGLSEFGYGSSIHHSGSFSTLSSSGSLSSMPSAGHHSSINRPPQGHHRNSLSSLPEPFVRDDYSSGLPPLSEGYPPQSSYQFQQTPSGFVQSPPPLPQTPAPSQFGVPSSVPYPMPSAFAPPPPPSSAMSFHSPQPQPQHPASPRTPFQYPAYSQSPASIPSHQYLPFDASLHSSSVPPVSQPAQPQQYVHHGTPSPPQQSHQGLPTANAYQQIQPGFPPPQGSRPLPNPQVQHQPRLEHQSSSGFASPLPGPPPPIGLGGPVVTSFQPPGPPPLPPARRGTSLPPTPTKTPSITHPPPPPPPLPNGVFQPQGSHLHTPPPPPPLSTQFHGGNSSPHGLGTQSPQPHLPQQSQSYGTWAPPPPPPPPPISGYSSSSHVTSPSHYPTPPPQSQQPYYPSGPSGPPTHMPTAPGWNSPPQHAAYRSQDGWHQ